MPVMYQQMFQVRVYLCFCLLACILPEQFSHDLMACNDKVVCVGTTEAEWNCARYFSKWKKEAASWTEADRVISTIKWNSRSFIWLGDTLIFRTGSLLILDVLSLNYICPCDDNHNVLPRLAVHTWTCCSEIFYLGMPALTITSSVIRVSAPAMKMKLGKIPAFIWIFLEFLV
jgi:hypothetical protein